MFEGMDIEAARACLDSLNEAEFQQVEEAVLGPDFWDRADEEYEKRRDGWYDY